ncbi:unnamed protein product [Adineta ricciae]|uniref:Protease Do-like PDZ domain-containing protein n=2 Tax=Adineta ricciae TaxID=249248 RepID=A0A815ANI7_ADIRI|nr:unnamed protein product [Adineta ricciae]
MEGSGDSLTDYLDSSTDQLSPSVIKRLNLGDKIEKNRQQQSTTSVSTLLDVKTNLDEVQSLESMLHSVVKIFCTSIPCSFDLPWQMRSQSTATASGFIINDRRILSNAHAVSNSSVIRIQKHGDTRKYPGRILHIAHECDLVMLTVDDKQFWNNVNSLIFNEILPELQDSILIVGYPIGGDNLSVTKGVVSRVCMSTYSHSLEYLLSIQIDAAINPGNSGGPAFQDKKVVGISFQGMNNVQSIGYIIPVLVIKHFLDDIQLHGKYTGFPRMVFHYQSMENYSFRKYLKLNDDQHGILITAVEPACILNKILKKDDVITGIDEKSIADDGTIDFRRGERLSFIHLSKIKFVGDEITFTIIREGKEMKLTSLLDNNSALVPLHSHDKRPDYLIYGGIVFTVLTRFYLYEWGFINWKQKAPRHLVNLALNGMLEEPDQQIVVINRVLVDEINYGIEPSVIDAILKTVNGIEIKNIKHLANVIDQISNSKENTFIRFETQSKSIIVVSCEDAKQSEERILTQNSIPHARSENLR